MSDSVMPPGEPERWLPVPGWEGLYDVSDLGRVRSLPRKTFKGVRGGQMLKGYVNGNLGPRGYPAVMLWRDGAPTRRHVHTLVLSAFVGPCPEGQEARHGPGGRLDGRLVNLRWGTHAENMRDKVRDGTSNRGERQGRAKLTWPKVAEIRARVSAGELKMHLASEFGVSARTIRDVASGRTWI